MSNITDKLREILGIKSDIKDAINEKGGSIEDSTAFTDYAQAIRDIQGGKPAIIGKYQPETKAKSKIIGADNYLEFKKPEVMEFSINGTLNNNGGIFSGFTYGTNFISNIYYTNQENVILRFKVKFNTISIAQNIVHAERCYHLQIGNDGILWAYCWKDNTNHYASFVIPVDTWLYLTIKFTNQGDNVLKQYYYSTTDFSTNESDKIFEFEDDLYTGSTSYYGGCIGVSSYNRSDPLLGEIDMIKTRVVDYDGNVVRRYYIPERTMDNKYYISVPFLTLDYSQPDSLPDWASRIADGDQWDFWQEGDYPAGLYSSMSSYHINNGQSQGYIEIPEEFKNEIESITANAQVSSEGNYDFFCMGLGTAEVYPARGSNFDTMLIPVISGEVKNTHTTDYNNEKYILLNYMKDGSGDTGIDRAILRSITFNRKELVPYVD